MNADEPSILGLTGGTVLGANLFAYCVNNPVMNSDPTGYFVSPANIIGAVIGGILGAVGGYFLSKYLADKLGLNGWKRQVFIWGLTAVITASAVTIGYFLGPYVAKAGQAMINSLKVMIKRYGFKSLGSTGRTVANSLTEKLAMEQVKSNPLKWGFKLSQIVLTDSRWSASAGWVKMQAVINTSRGKVVIHFVYNTILEVFDDFKFK